MLLKLTRPEMLDLWRLHHAHLPPLKEANARRYDTISTDSLFEVEMDAWYRRMLLEAPPELLKVSDLAGSVVMAGARAADGSTPLGLPSSVVRPLSVRLSSWHRAATIDSHPSAAAIALQSHPYTRATRSLPAALAVDGELRLYPGARPSDSLLSLRCITLTDGIYEFDSTLLPQIQPQ